MGQTGGRWHILGTGMQAMCRTGPGDTADSHGTWRSWPHVAIKECSKLNSKKNNQQPQFEFIQHCHSGDRTVLTVHLSLRDVAQHLVLVFF